MSANFLGMIEKPVTPGAMEDEDSIAVLRTAPPPPPTPSIDHHEDGTKACIQLSHVGGPHVLESPVGVPNEWQGHVGRVLITQCINLRAVLGGSVFLRDVLDREISRVDIRGEFWLERSADGAQRVPGHPSEEGVSLDLHAAGWTMMTSETVWNITEHAVGVSVVIVGSGSKPGLTFGYSLPRRAIARDPDHSPAKDSHRERVVFQSN